MSIRDADGPSRSGRGWSRPQKILGVAGLLLAVSAALIIWLTLGSAPGANEAAGVGSDRLPNTSAAEWVTYPDHVIVVTPVSDKLNDPTAWDRERGEGILLRTTVLKASEVLWSREDATQPAPDTITWLTAGTAFKKRVDKQRPMVLADQPRIELGHTYIAAVSYSAAFCSEGDPPQPAEWFPVGQSAVLPYDDQVIGQGEYEGRLVTPQEMASLGGPESAVRTRMIGLSKEALVKS